jgi:hypothetical protein
VKQRVALIEPPIKITTQINAKLNDVSSADENKKYNCRAFIYKLQKDNTFVHRQKTQELYLFLNVIMQSQLLGYSRN